MAEETIENSVESKLWVVDFTYKSPVDGQLVWRAPDIETAKTEILASLREGISDFTFVGTHELTEDDDAYDEVLAQMQALDQQKEQLN